MGVIPPRSVAKASRAGVRRDAAAVVLVLVVLVAWLTVMETASRGESPKADPRSVEWVCANKPDRVRALFDSLDLDRPGMATVKKAVLAKDYPAACTALIEYYRSAPTARWLRHDAVTPRERSWPDADAILADTVNFYGHRSRIRRTASGAIDWTYKGPDNAPEWRYSLNDLLHCNTLMAAYLDSGQPKYAERIDADIRDWILANPCPNKLDILGNWRGIETSARVQSWMQLFYGLQYCREFSPAARILMLSSLVDHAHQLMLFHHPGPANWTIGELKGLAIVGSAWPEFEDATGWRYYAMEHLGNELADNVYPDGAEMELTSMYHRVTVESFSIAMSIFQDFGYAVPDSLSSGIERMWNYLAYTARPDGTAPENNDSDRQSIRDKVLAAADQFHRKDWIYIVTNGKDGKKPATPPSVTFPWAGQAIMRSGWDADAQWSFFDIGPYGTAHQHRDKLHLSVDAFGRALLVDSGRYSYDDQRYRDYFTGAAAHNVILIDGGDQAPNAMRASAPVSTTEFGTTPTWDYARSIFDSGYNGVKGLAIHTRAVVYVHNEFWVVADRIETDRPRTIEALWHFAPDCHVRVDKRDVFTDDKDIGNLRIAPIGGITWHPTIVRGSTSPIQGWYSAVYGTKVPNPTAVYSADLPGTTTFAWVLVPTRGPVPDVQTSIVSSRPERIEVRVQTRPGVSYDITIPMNAWKPTVRKRGG